MAFERPVVSQGISTSSWTLSKETLDSWHSQFSHVDSDGRRASLASQNSSMEDRTPTNAEISRCATFRGCIWDCRVIRLLDSHAHCNTWPSNFLHKLVERSIFHCIDSQVDWKSQTCKSKKRREDTLEWASLARRSDTQQSHDITSRRRRKKTGSEVETTMLQADTDVHAHTPFMLCFITVRRTVNTRMASALHNTRIHIMCVPKNN